MSLEGGDVPGEFLGDRPSLKAAVFKYFDVSSVCWVPFGKEAVNTLFLEHNINKRTDR